MVIIYNKIYSRELRLKDLVLYLGGGKVYDPSICRATRYICFFQKKKGY